MPLFGGERGRALNAMLRRCRSDISEDPAPLLSLEWLHKTCSHMCIQAARRSRPERIQVEVWFPRCAGRLWLQMR